MISLYPSIKFYELVFEGVDLFFLRKLANEVASSLCVGEIVFLLGDLGAGKTTFCKFLISSLAISEENVVDSPTFNIINVYDSERFSIWHCDFYRIKSPQELGEFGIEDALKHSVILIEWPQITENILKPDLTIEFLHSNAEDKRNIKISSHTPHWISFIKNLLKYKEARNAD